MAQNRAGNVRGMGAAGNRLVCDSNKSTDEFGLTDSPAGQTDSSASREGAKCNEEERQPNGQESTDDHSGKHP